MTLKQYQWVKLAVVVSVAVVFSQAVISKSFLIPIATLVIATLFLLYLRRKVTEIVADERDYATGGKAALLAMQIYAWGATLGMFTLYHFRDYNPGFEPVAMTLAYSTCVLMFLYALIFRYYNRVSLSDKKTKYIIFVFIFGILGAMFTLRLFSGEDDWACKNGEWVKHGQPSFSAPSIPCKK